MASVNIEKDFFRAINEGVLIPVLMYHGIYHKDDSKNRKNIHDGRHDIDSDTFWNQMSFLYQHGYQAVPLETCVAAARGYLNGVLPEKAVAITFDDGYESNFTVALPILEQFNLLATFFITTEQIDSDNYLSSHQIKELDKSGMLIGSHTATHRFLTELDVSNLNFELLESKRVLESLIEQPVKKLSVPGGRSNDFVLDAVARAGYELVCTSRNNDDESASDVLAQSIFEMIPPRLSRLAITNDMDMETFMRIVEFDEMEILRRQRKQTIFSASINAFGGRNYNALWEQYWTSHALVSQA